MGGFQILGAIIPTMPPMPHISYPPGEDRGRGMTKPVLCTGRRSLMLSCIIQERFLFGLLSFKEEMLEN